MCENVMVFVRPIENPVLSVRAVNIRISYGDKWVDFKSGSVVISDNSGKEVFETRAYPENDRKAGCLDADCLGEMHGCTPNCPDYQGQ